MSDKQTFEISVDISWDGGETTEKVIIDDTTYDYDDIVPSAFNQAEDSLRLFSFILPGKSRES
jgi:hypothetical protein